MGLSETEEQDLGKSRVRRMLLEVCVELVRVEGSGVAGINHETSAEPSKTLSLLTLSAMEGSGCTELGVLFDLSGESGTSVVSLALMRV